MYYLPVEEGGLGMRSLEAEVKGARVRMDMQARNDVSYTHATQGEATVQAGVVEAAWRRYGRNPKPEHATGKVTMCAAVEEARRYMQVQARHTATGMRVHEAHAKDRARMEEAGTGGNAEVYTDGSTVPGMSPTAGWGWVRYGTGGSTLGRRVGEGSGRLAGEQNNYKAEAWALLDALASMHQTTDANIYIDNYAVVQRWAGDKRGHTRGRSKEPARAVWSRIDAIRAVRKQAGATTRVRWVHSHVEPAQGEASIPQTAKKQKTQGDKKAAGERGKQAAPQCACGAAGGRCDPDHKHHRGNDAADALANEGRTAPVPDTDYHSPLCGEERVHMVREGKVCEGDITEELKEANRQRVRAEMRAGKAHMRQLTEMLDCSDKVWRHGVMRGKTLSTRYKVRAMSDSMPTMKHEGDKVQGGNAYHYMYGDHIEGGKCSCGSGAQETMHHIFTECEHTRAVRDKALGKLGTMWGARTGGRVRLLEIDYITQPGWGAWQRWWGWMGLVPKEVRGKVDLGEVKLVMASAKVLAEAGRDMWDARNDAQQRWELERGIAQRKMAVRRREWKKAPTGKARGRPKKALEDLSAKYRMRLEGEERVRERVLAGMTREEAQKTVRKESAKQRKAAVRLDKDRVQHRQHGQGLDGVAMRTTREENERQYGQALRPHKRGLPAAGKGRKVKKVTGLSKRTKAACRAGDEQSRDTDRAEEAEGACAVRGCNRAATQPALGCTKGSRRCDRLDHVMAACRGKGGMVACDCCVVEVDRDKYGRTRKKYSGDLPARARGTQKMSKADKERAAMDRCYEVDIGDRVEIDTHDEGTVRGVITNMLWRGEMGFRQPDALEVQWHSDAGELQMGEIEMWEQWRRVEGGQGGEGEAPEPEPKAPAGVPATNSEAETARGEGGAGVRSVRGDGEGAEDGAAAVQPDSEGLGETRKRSTRTSLSNGEAASARGQAYGRTYVRTGGQRRALNGAAAGTGQPTGSGVAGGHLGTERVSPEIELPNKKFQK